MSDDIYDVIVIGAGFVGSMIIRELSKYNIKIGVIEKEPYPGFGVTKGSLSWIHLNHFCPPGSLRARLCMNAPERFKRLAEELNANYRETGELMLAFNNDQMYEIKTRMEWGKKNGEKVFKLINPQEVRKLEPNINKDVVAAVYSFGHGVIHPTEWTFALVENAKHNGADVLLNTEVKKIEKDEKEDFLIYTNHKIIKSHYIVNAAGIFADEIATMVGDKNIKLRLYKATMAIFDKSVSNIINNIIYVGGLKRDHSQLVAPTLHGNLIIGLGYFKDTESKSDEKVTKESLDEIIKMGFEIVPNLPVNDIITFFSGIESTNNLADNGDFYINYSNRSKKIIHALISSPGITGSIGIAELIVNMLSNSGLDLKEKKDFVKKVKMEKRFFDLGIEEKEKLIEKNNEFGHIVCRCEMVTEGDIKDAISCGIDTVDGIKHYTRAGMGRCQGGFCEPWIIRYLSEELGLSPTQITKKGTGSELIKGFTKEED